MPWKYIREDDADSLQARQQTLDRIGSWWTAFAARRAAIEATVLGGGGAPWDIDAWTADHLHAIDLRLAWQYAHDPDAGFSIAITPSDNADGGRNLAARPIIESILAAAPMQPGWTFSGFRAPQPPESVDEIVRARTGQSWLGAMVQPRIGSGNRVDVTWQTRLAAQDEAAARAAALVATEALLGDAMMDRWIGDVDVIEPNPLQRSDEFLLPQRLCPNVEALIGSILSTVPAVPYCQQINRETKFHTYRLDPRPKSDYVGQEDMVVGNSMAPDLRQAALSGRPFYSTSFSRAGDLFCYLKVDLPGIHMDDRRRQRKQMEDSFERALRKSGVAGVIGSGTGLRYAYYDLAVIDMESTLRIIQSGLRPLGLPDRSWLLFCDSELADEWIPLHPDAPPPPRPKVEQAAVATDAQEESVSLPPASYEFDSHGFLP